jgi:hypothetical protein
LNIAKVHQVFLISIYSSPFASDTISRQFRGSKSAGRIVDLTAHRQFIRRGSRGSPEAMSSGIFIDQCWSSPMIDEIQQASSSHPRRPLLALHAWRLLFPNSSFRPSSPTTRGAGRSRAPSARPSHDHHLRRRGIAAFPSICCAIIIAPSHSRVN